LDNIGKFWIPIYTQKWRPSFLDFSKTLKFFSRNKNQLKNAINLFSYKTSENIFLRKSLFFKKIAV